MPQKTYLLLLGLGVGITAYCSFVGGESGMDQLLGQVSYC